jgi:threonine dehydrogenase-like Zn-dependent dehydrogenase
VWSVWLERSALRRRGQMHIGQPARRDPPLPGARWVRVNNNLAGIGEADRALALGDTQGTAAQLLPQPQRRYLGREVVGIVSEVGPEVTLVRVDDRVVLNGEPLSTCATLGLQPPCKPCATGNPALCDHRAVPWPGMGAGWGDAMVVHESQLFLVPDVLSDEQAVLLEPAARAVRAVGRRTPEPGMRALVIGGDAVGLLVAESVRALAPSVEVALATDAPHERRAAQASGFTEIISAGAGQLSSEGARLTNAQTFQRQGTTYVLGGFDIIYDCLGTNDSLAESVRLARSGGMVAIVAAPARAVRLDPSLVQQDEISIVGVAGAGMEPPPPDVAERQGGRWSSLSVAARLLRKGQIDAAHIITARLDGTARDFRKALSAARAGNIRVVVTYEGGEAGASNPLL